VGSLATLDFLASAGILDKAVPLESVGFLDFLESVDFLDSPASQGFLESAVNLVSVESLVLAALGLVASPALLALADFLATPAFPVFPVFPAFPAFPAFPEFLDSAV